MIHKAVCLAKDAISRRNWSRSLRNCRESLAGCTPEYSNWIHRLPEATRAVRSLMRSTISTSRSRPTMTFRDRWKGLSSRSATRPTRLPECFPLGWCRADRKIHLRSGGRRMAIVKIIAEKKLPLRLNELMQDARTGYQKSEAARKFVDDATYRAIDRELLPRAAGVLPAGCPRIPYDVVKVSAGGRCRRRGRRAGSRRGCETGPAHCRSSRRLARLASGCGTF